MCLYSDILSDILFDILSGIYSDILSGIYSDNLSDILSGILSDIYSGILSGIFPGVLFWRSLLAFSLLDTSPIASGARDEIRAIHRPELAI